MVRKLCGIVVAIAGALMLAPASAQQLTLEQWLLCMDLTGNDESICGPEPA